MITRPGSVFCTAGTRPLSLVFVTWRMSQTVRKAVTGSRALKRRK